MQLSVNGKQIDVSDALRSHIEDSLPTIVTKYFENPTDGHVTMTREGKGFKADISVHVGKGIIVQSHASSEDAYAVFHTAADHIAKRLRRYKRRLRDHHRGRDETLKSVEMPQYVLEPSVETQDEPSVQDQPLIIAEMATRVENLTVSEAVMRMDLSGQSALLFHNSANGAINLVYLRSDGNFGWIDTSGDANAEDAAS